MNNLNIAAADSTVSSVFETFLSIVSSLIEALGTIAGFFTSNPLGLIILGVVLFGVVWSVILHLINR